MDHVKDEHISFDDIISELPTSIRRCKPECSTCHKYILKLTIHLNSAHTDPSGSAEEESEQCDLNRGERDTDEVRGQKNSEFHDDHSLNIIDSDVIDIKYEYDLDVDSNVYENRVVEDPPNSDLSVGVNCNSENASAENDQAPGDSPPDSSDNTRTCDLNFGKRRTRMLKSGKINRIENQKRKPTGDEPISVSIKSRPYECKICRVGFMRKSLLVIHERRKHSTREKRYNCEKCSKSFDSRRLLNTHTCTHLPKVKKISTYLCSVCNKKFTSNSKLTRHELVHTGEKPFECDECGKRFSRQDRLSLHKVRMHTEHSLHTCEICSKNFPLKRLLSEHMLVHVEGSHACPICYKELSCKKNLMRHMKLHKGEQSFSAPDNPNSAERHPTCETDSQKSQETSNGPTCSFCHKGFAATKNLERHMRLHTGEKPYKCDQCDSCYHRVDDLRRHKLSHGEVKPYKCDQCDNCYARKDKLMKHMRSHPRSKPRCDLCKKCFSKISVMIRHRRVHTGEKPFKCDQCDECFSRNDALNRHKNTHIGDKL